MGIGPINYLGPAATVASSVLSFLGQSDANKKNLQAVQETNELNYKMWGESQDFTREMFQRQLDYNDPSNLRRMLENAGYNPAALVAAANGLLGSAPSSGSPSPIPAQAGHVDNELGQASQLAVQGVGVAADAINKIEEAKGKSIDNSNKQQQWNLLLDNLVKTGFLTQEQAEKYAWENLITEYSFDALSKTAQKNLYKLDVEARKSEADAALTNWLRENKAPREVVEINEHINLLLSQGRYYDAMAYATKKGVPYTLANLKSQTFKNNAEGLLDMQQYSTQEPLNKALRELYNSDWYQKSMKAGKISKELQNVMDLFLSPLKVAGKLGR